MRRERADPAPVPGCGQAGNIANRAVQTMKDKTELAETRTLSLIVLVPNEDAVPERLPSTTQAGNLTLRKLPKGERSALYLLLIAGHVLVTLREAFAVAPGVDAARVIAVRRSGPDIYGRPVLDCIVAGRWTRMAFNGVRWTDADAGNILAGTATELVLNEKRGQILPVDLSSEPEIRDLLSTMDTTDPVTED
jgi:hypothetical protein